MEYLSEHGAGTFAETVGTALKLFLKMVFVSFCKQFSHIFW